MTGRTTIPIVAADTEGDCAGAESFALLVLGDSMAPEVVEGEVIVVESLFEQFVDAFGDGAVERGVGHGSGQSNPRLPTRGGRRAPFPCSIAAVHFLALGKKSCSPPIL